YRFAFSGVFIQVIIIEPDVTPRIDVNHLELPAGFAQSKEGTLAAKADIQTVIRRQPAGVNLTYHKLIFAEGCSRQVKSGRTPKGTGISLSRSIIKDHGSRPSRVEVVTEYPLDIVNAVVFWRIRSSSGIRSDRFIEAGKFTACNAKSVADKAGEAAGIAL